MSDDDGLRGLGDERWYRWRPELSEHEDYREILQAVSEFESLDTEAGHAAVEWLQNESLPNHPSTITWIAYRPGIVEGFYALASAHIKLNQRQRKSWWRGRHEDEDKDAHELHPLQPASLIAWIAKHRHGSLPGKALVLHAAWIATRVAEMQGNIALAVDAYDERIAAIWRDDYGFRSSQTLHGNQQRLWLPLSLTDPD